MMELFSRAYQKVGISRYGIRSNEKCIACTECSRNCLVGIDVMSFALKQETITNADSSCIGCGICGEYSSTSTGSGSRSLLW